MSDPTWDTSKENFQPLKKGRDPRRMDEATNMRQGERVSKIQDERRCVRHGNVRTPGTVVLLFFESDWSCFFFVLTTSLRSISSLQPPQQQRLLGCHRQV
jgi:hypothetical protein